MKYAPQEIFEQILEWSVITTFDLVLEIEDQGFVMVKRKIAPYKDKWALPGLRMYKDESIDDTLVRIAIQEVGIEIDPAKKVLVGQYVGKFATEHNRQDLSTGYYFKLPPSTEVVLNEDHFSSHQVSYEAPKPMGAMYEYYLGKVSGK